MNAEISGMSAWLAGARVVDTTRVDADFTLDERTQWIVEKFGAEAAAIVLGLARELNVTPASALELAQAGEPSFRAACECHVASLRQKAADQRAASARSQAQQDRRHQRESIFQRVTGVAYLLDAAREHREMSIRSTHAMGQTLSDESLARLDADIASLETQLADARVQLEAHDANAVSE